MGVAGSGKTTVGAALGRALGWPFFDGDKFHSQANVDKMAQGVPLTDADRAPWLQRLNHLLADKLAAGQSIVLACSALKESYRRTLQGDLDVSFVYLKGSFELVNSRLKDRPGHYLPPGLLQSQFDALEEPAKAVAVDVKKNVDDIVLEVLFRLAFSAVSAPPPLIRPR